MSSPTTTTPQLPPLRLSIPTLKIKSLVVPGNLVSYQDLSEYIQDAFNIPTQRQKYVWNKRRLKLSPEAKQQENLRQHLLDSLPQSKKRKMGLSGTHQKSPLHLQLIGSIPPPQPLQHLSITDCLLHVMKYLSVTELRNIQMVSTEWCNLVRTGSNLNHDRYWMGFCNMEDSDNTDLMHTNRMEEENSDDDSMNEEDEQDRMVDEQFLSRLRTSRVDGVGGSVFCFDTLTGEHCYEIPHVQYFLNQNDFMDWDRERFYRGAEYALVVRKREHSSSTEQESDHSSHLEHPEEEIMQCIHVASGRLEWSQPIQAFFPEAITHKVRHIRNLSFMKRNTDGDRSENNTIFHRLIQEQEEADREHARTAIFDEDVRENQERSILESQGTRILVNRMVQLMEHMEEDENFSLGSASQVIAAKYFSASGDLSRERLFVQFRTHILSLEPSTGKLVTVFIPSPHQDNLLVVMENPLILFKDYIALTIKDNLLHILDTATLSTIRVVRTQFERIAPCIPHMSNENGQMFIMLDSTNDHIPHFRLISRRFEDLAQFHTTHIQLSENYLINLDSHDIVDLDTLEHEFPKGLSYGADLEYAYEMKGYIQGYVHIQKNLSSGSRFGHATNTSSQFSSMIQKLNIVRKGKEVWKGTGFDSKRVTEEECDTSVIWQYQTPFHVKSSMVQVEADQVYVLVEKDSSNLPDSIVLSAGGHSNTQENLTKEQLHEIQAMKKDSSRTYYSLLCFHQDYGHVKSRFDFSLGRWRVVSFDLLQGMLFIWLKSTGQTKVRTGLRIVNSYGTLVFSSDCIRGVDTCWNIVRGV